MAKDILKEAIADAKAVREVALANAKAALEEAFTPKLQSMLSAKLSEDIEETYDEDEKVDEMMYDEDEKDKMEGMGMYDEDEKDEDMKESDLDEEIDLEEILNELELEEEKDEDKVDEAKKDDDDKMEEAKKDDDKDDVKEAKDDDDDIKKEGKDDEDVKKEELDELGRPIYKSEEANYAGYTADRVHEGEDFDLDALLEEINNLEEEKDEDDVKEVKHSKDDDKDDVKEAKDEDEVKEEVNPLAAELEETKAALETVRAELNEVNLLNSKLLYVNRIFKANQLDESQKLRVVETLDKAETAKEAKLIYETIKDTFNVAKSKKASFKNKTKSLKEGIGMASKAAGTSTAPKQEVISESTNMVNRFQKLANIKINE